MTARVLASGRSAIAALYDGWCAAPVATRIMLTCLAAAAVLMT